MGHRYRSTDAGTGVKLNEVFMHHCEHPRHRKTHTCEVCGNLWVPYGEGGWHCDDTHDVEIVGVVVRDSTGFVRKFGVSA